MADALTPTQIILLRRLRDGTELAAPPVVNGIFGEIAFLNAIGLVHVHAFFDVRLTDFGAACLAAA